MARRAPALARESTLPGRGTAGWKKRPDCGELRERAAQMGGYLLCCRNAALGP